MYFWVWQIGVVYWCLSFGSPGYVGQLSLEIIHKRSEIIQVNIPLPCVFTVSTVGAPILGELISIPTFANPAPPHSPCFRARVASGLRARLILVLHGLRFVFGRSRAFIGCGWCFRRGVR